MNLIPLVRGMKLFCRRTINVGGQKYFEGQALPYKQLAISFRMLLKLYEQRRVVSESDPYFQELLETYGKNNPEFAKVWLKENAVEKTVEKPKPKKSRSTKVKAENERNSDRKKKSTRKK